MTRRAPDACDYTFHTTTGAVTFRAWRALSPAGADRLHNLARLGHYDGGGSAYKPFHPSSETVLPIK
jgi:hypothetical protein